jgi:hypothetical protein
MALTETDWEGVDWINLAQNRDNWTLVNMVMNLQVA